MRKGNISGQRIVDVTVENGNCIISEELDTL
jgi:hypothetical protein